MFGAHGSAHESGKIENCRVLGCSIWMIPGSKLEVAVIYLQTKALVLSRQYNSDEHWMKMPLTVAELKALFEVSWRVRRSNHPIACC